MKRLLIYLSLSLFITNVFGQIKTISREEMVQDIDILFSTIEKIHPDMYAVYPKDKLNREIERVKDELKDEADIFYFFKKVNPLVVKLGDGHTGGFFPRAHLGLDPNIRLFPFTVKVTYPARAIVVQNDFTHSQTAIPGGGQITKINNRPAKEIVQEMMNLVSGEKAFFKTERLEVLFTPLLYALYRDSVFDIEYEFDQKRQSVQVKGIPHDERYKSRPVEHEESQEIYSLSMLPDKNIGILDIQLFVSDPDEFTLFLDSAFQVLQDNNIGNLIIDLRENGGGNSRLGDEVFQYISPVPFAQFGKTIMKYSDIQKAYYRDNYNREVTNPNGIEILNENPELTELRENDFRYNGEVYLLISHYTFSSAASFSWAFKHFNMGTVIGQESGGIAVCFGDNITQKLPHTGIYYSVSHKKFYQYGATDENTHGTLPDYVVPKEKALDFTMDMITKQQ